MIACGLVVSGKVHSQRIAHIEEEALWAANAIVTRVRKRIEDVSLDWAPTHCAFGAKISGGVGIGKKGRER